MNVPHSGGRWRPWSMTLTALAAVLLVSAMARAQVPATMPATMPSMAAPAAPTVIDGDPTGATGAGGSLIAPNAFLPGWTGGSADKAGTWHPYTDEKGNATDTPNLTGLNANVAKTFYSLNITWTLVCGFLVMFMQAGFALVETGLIRGKNAAHTMSMNFLVYALGMFGFFICGFAFMCGGANGTMIGGPGQLGGMLSLASTNTMWGIHVGDHFWGLCGHQGFFLTGKSYDASIAVWFLFEMVFMDTTATIVTGACAERWKLSSFFIFSIFIGAVIYPIFGCWVWGGGWLAQMGQYWGLGNGACDYAGSGVVHLQGGALAFICALMIGPRLGKYDRNGKLKNPIVAHNLPMVMLGCFFLAFGWFGFNPGSSLAASDNRVGIVAVNTMLAGMSATLSSVLYMWWVGPTKKPDPAMMCNGILAGLVAITAPSGFVTPVGAFIIGLVAGVLVVWSCMFFDKIRVDDPVGAISIHGVCGAFGVLAVGLFADGTSYGGYNGVSHNVTGLFYGGGLGQLEANAIEVLACVVWNVGLGGILFFITGLLVGGNRVSARVEIAGLDMPEMGAMGYPETTRLVLPEQLTDAQVEAVTNGDMLEPVFTTAV